jgi:hypothetical protein
MSQIMLENRKARLESIESIELLPVIQHFPGRWLFNFLHFLHQKSLLVESWNSWIIKEVFYEGIVYNLSSIDVPASDGICC